MGGEREVDPADEAAVSRANLGSAGGPELDGAGTEWVESDIWADSVARANRGSRAKRGSAGRARPLAGGTFWRRGSLGGQSDFGGTWVC